MLPATSLAKSLLEKQRARNEHPDATARIVPEGSDSGCLPAGCESLVASSAAGAVNLDLQGAGVGRLHHQDRPEHHATVTQPPKLACPVNLRRQVRLILLCVNLPQPANLSALHGTDLILLGVDMPYFILCLTVLLA